MYAVSVEKPTFRSQVSLDIKKVTQKSATNAMCVGKLLPEVHT